MVATLKITEMFPSVDTPLTLEVNYLRGVLLLNYNWHIQVNYRLLYPSQLISLSGNKNSHLPLRTPASQRTPQTGDYPGDCLGCREGRSILSHLCEEAHIFALLSSISHRHHKNSNNTESVSWLFCTHRIYYRAFCWFMKKSHYHVCVSICGLLLLTWLQEKSKRE